MKLIYCLGLLALACSNPAPAPKPAPKPVADSTHKHPAKADSSHAKHPKKDKH